MIDVRSNNLSLKYQRFEPLGCKDTGIINFLFVAKTQFLSELLILSLTINYDTHKRNDYQIQAFQKVQPVYFKETFNRAFN